METRFRIMLVDDEPIVVKRLKRLLEKDCYEVEGFTRGSIAIQELENRHFDIIITDLKMGSVGGMKILETAVEKHPSSKVIIISGITKIEIVEEAFAKGAFGYIMKPFKIEELKKIIREAVIVLKTNPCRPGKEPL
ncbi:MAG: response regulator [Nitrospirota bacterium]